MIRPAAPALALFVALAAAAPLAARSLHWSALEVEATLDGDGRLHVVERQTMVFDGAWNGGERTFAIRPGQRLDLDAVRRLDPERGAVTLVAGDLERVDQFDWVERGVLRWRSRLPTDPPFDDTTLVYELEYTLERILQPLEEPNRYRLDHDFAFPDRVGDIERFALTLALDRDWRLVAGPDGVTGPRIDLERGPLRPGEGAVVTLELEHRGAAAPAAVARRVPGALRQALALAMLAAAAVATFMFLRFERRHGRFARLETPAVLDQAWLEEHVHDLRPEEAGALWDRTVASPEVSALLARLEAEGKIATATGEPGAGGRGWLRRRRPEMKLELLVDREGLAGYERRLVDQLFFDDRREVDTAALRQHYRGSGFSPAVTIRPELERRLGERASFGERLPGPSWLATLVLLVAGVGGLVVERVTRGEEAAGPVLAVLLAALVLPVPLTLLLAEHYRRRADRLGATVVALLAPITLAITGAAWTIVYGPGRLAGLDDIGVAGLLAIAALPLGFFLAALNVARTRDPGPAVAARQRLAAVRRFFRRELAKPLPALEDGWQPYLLALGLDRDMERWLEAFGGASADASDLAVAAPARSAPHSPRWTGGTIRRAGWASSLRSMAAGVSTGGSGSGGGGSSGGGGGGGW